MVQTPLSLVAGQRYRVVFQIAGVHRKPHYFVMDYMAEQSDGYERRTYWNARPVAGTQSIRPEWILSYKPVAKSEKIVLDAIDRG